MNSSIQQLMAQAMSLYQVGQQQESLALCQQVLVQEPDNFDALHLSGIIAYQSGRYAEAVNHLKKAVNLHSTHPFVHNSLGVSYKALNRLTEAEAAYRQALALKPDYAFAHNNLGVVLTDTGRLQEAESCFRQALSYTPDYPEAHYNLGNLLLLLNRPVEAEAAYRQNLALAPDNAPAMVSLNHILAQRLPTKSYLTTSFFGLTNQQAFCKALLDLVVQTQRLGWWAGDNLITFERNLGFLEDVRFMTAATAHVATHAERASLWRYHTLCWAAHRALKLPGDFMECACYKGTSARIICDYVDFAISGKRYFLYDLFDHDPTMPHHAMSEDSAQLYAWVKERFFDIPTVTVTQGRVPDVLHEVAPEQIAFLHLDLNNAAAEIGALELLWERMVPGAVLVLDDYGWLAYRDQHVAENAFFERIGYKILELPTGQGLLIK